MRWSCLACRLLALWCLLVSWGTLARADNWPQWRGPTNDGLSRETNLPVEWSATKNVVWKLPLPGLGGSTPIVWGERLFLTSPDVPSPLIHDGLVYLCGEFGSVTCLDAKTGQERYQERGYNSRYRASPVYADGKLYLTARAGTFHVLKAGPKYELLATNRLPDTFTASPVIAGGRIYLRGFEALYAIGTSGK